MSIFPCVQRPRSGPLPGDGAAATVQGMEASAGKPSWILTLLLFPQVLILTLADLSAVTHLLVSASNLNGKQVMGTPTSFLQPAPYGGIR